MFFIYFDFFLAGAHHALREIGQDLEIGMVTVQVLVLGVISEKKVVLLLSSSQHLG